MRWKYLAFWDSRTRTRIYSRRMPVLRGALLMRNSLCTTARVMTRGCLNCSPRPGRRGARRLKLRNWRVKKRAIIRISGCCQTRCPRWRAAHAVLARVDSVRSSEYDARLADFLASLKPIEQRIATLRARVKGMPITATEPLADYLTQALGLRMRNARFQRAIMKGSEPSVADTAAFEDDLRQRRVKALIDNAQTTSGHARRMLMLTNASGVAVARLSEILPAGMTYQRWMQRQLDVLERALFP